MTLKIHTSPPSIPATLIEIFKFILVFLVVFTSAKFGDYLYFEWNTAPTALLPSTGIATAIIWIYGYRYVMPIFFALIAAFTWGSIMDTEVGGLIRSVTYTLGSVTAAYLLKRFGFDGSFSNMRTISLFLGVIIVASSAPLLLSFLVAVLTGVSTIVDVSWVHSLMGHLLSGLILFPLIVSWVKNEEPINKRHLVDVGLTTALLLVAIYFLFWVPIRFEYTFFFFALLFVAFFWVGIQFSTRALTLAMATTTVFGILGLFLSPDPETMLNEQLFIAELFLFLVFPIFYTISALVKERAHTIEKLKIAMDKIERENITKNEFIAVLAHELRNPLAPIKSTLEILSLGELEPETQNLVIRAQQQVKAMQRLLSDLLDITRVTQGKFQLRVTQVNLCELIQDCIESTMYVFKDRNHSITLSVDCPKDLVLAVDPIRFEQVLVNILMNAAKYTDPGGAIQVYVHILDGRVEIRVQDNGMGIEAEHLETVFKPFWQMKKTGVSAMSGIGVGLWLTRRIVEMHGGTITAESEGRGKGSTFVITIPILEVETPTMITMQPEGQHQTIKNKILIGDDNKPAADSLRKLLSMKGHEAYAVYSGEEVLTMVEECVPDIILLDIGLIDMTGYMVAKKLRENGYTKKIIALSGYGQEEDRREALRSGFDYHFTKPMSIDAFEEYIANK